MLELPVGGEREVSEYARSRGDMNYLHHDKLAAKAVGLHGIIAPGLMVVEFINAAIPAEIPGIVVCRLELDFKQYIYADSHLSVFFAVRPGKVSARVFVTVKNGFVVVAEGQCRLALPQALVSAAA